MPSPGRRSEPGGDFKLGSLQSFNKSIENDRGQNLAFTKFFKEISEASESSDEQESEKLKGKSLQKKKKVTYLREETK